MAVISDELEEYKSIETKRISSNSIPIQLADSKDSRVSRSTSSSQRISPTSLVLQLPEEVAINWLMFFPPRDLVFNIRPVCKTFAYYVLSTIIFSLRFSRITVRRCDGVPPKLYLPHFNNSHTVDFINTDTGNEITSCTHLLIVQASISVNYKLARAAATSGFFRGYGILADWLWRQPELTHVMHYWQEISYGPGEVVHHFSVSYPITWKFKPYGRDKVEIVGFAVELDILIRLLIHYSETESDARALREFVY